MRLHRHERDRLDSLHSYHVLGTPAEASYDVLTRLAALLCKTPIAAISLVDEHRQWFKSMHGMSPGETPREVSISSDLVADGRPLVVPDTTRDSRYAANPQVVHEPGIRAYAGVPIVGRDGLPLGALCVIDHRPRRFTADQLEGLELLAGQVVAQLELRRVDRGAGRDSDELLLEATDPARLRQALDRGELYPHFQPIVDLRTAQTLGFEALLRWHHPQHGVLPPSMFLPVIESTRLIVPVGRHVLDLSLGMLAELRADPTLPEMLGVAVNVSGAQLQRPGLAEVVLSSLEQHGVPPVQLSVEITETLPILDAGNALRELTALREAGVHLALDDYGVGFSALSRLLELPLTALKLDRSLVLGLPDDSRSAAVARSTFALADDMGIDVVCEGVETEPQRAALLDMGARYGQGWLFGRAMEGALVRDYVRNDSSRHRQL
jgi:EAL domain-containing protein (putative c-di-GMP-specific phosphodiesterase class I)